jgi:hypothetical protein
MWGTELLKNYSDVVEFVGLCDINFFILSLSDKQGREVTAVNAMQSLVAKGIEVGAEGGSRTRTTLRSTDFKSVASAIPPPRLVSKNITVHSELQNACCWRNKHRRIGKDPPLSGSPCQKPLAV